MLVVPSGSPVPSQWETSVTSLDAVGLHPQPFRRYGTRDLLSCGVDHDCISGISFIKRKGL